MILKKLVVMGLVVLSLWFSQSSGALAGGGFNRYVDTIDGYEFLYPLGWLEVKVSRDNGPDVVFRDLIEQTENVSVVINPIPDRKTLQDLGTPSEVGYRLSKAAIAPPDSGRQAELVNAEARQVEGQDYYILEYAVKLPNHQERHNLASAVVHRNQLYTFNASTTEKRWAKVQKFLKTAVYSFKVT
jgi:photosystem II oxygen-evolving enhancer protein 2